VKQTSDSFLPALYALPARNIHPAAPVGVANRYLAAVRRASQRAPPRSASAGIAVFYASAPGTRVPRAPCMRRARTVFLDQPIPR
jgi:hypothetical protein